MDDSFEARAASQETTRREAERTADLQEARLRGVMPACVQRHRTEVIIPILEEAVRRFQKARHETVRFERPTGKEALRVAFKCWDDTPSEFASIVYTGAIGEESLACLIEGTGKFARLVRQSAPAHFEAMTRATVQAEVDAFIEQFFRALRNPSR